MSIRIFILFILFCSGFSCVCHAQQPEESYRRVEERLYALATTVPGLQKKVKLSVSGVSVQEFLRALAQANDLNINVDPTLNFNIVNNFRDETALNVLLFLSKTYQLDINVIGSIMSISKLPGARPVYKVKDPDISYNVNNGALTYNLQNDTLTRVAQKISAISNKNVIVPVSLNGKLVSGYMAEAPFETAVEKLAYANSLKYKKTNDNVYVLENLIPGEEVFINDDRQTDIRFRPGAQQIQGAGGINGMGGGNTGGNNYAVYGKSNGDKGKLFTIQAANTPIGELIKRASEDANVDYFLYSQLDGNITTNVKNISFDQFLSSIFQGTPYTYRIDNGIYLIGNRKNEGLRTSKIIQLQHRSIDTMMTMIPMEWKRDVEIKEFREQNMLLLSGSSPQITEIEAYIHKLDKIVPMVLIEVTLLDINKGNTVKTGIKMGVADSIPQTGGSLFPALDFTFGAGSINRFLSFLGKNNAFNLGRVTPNFYVTLSALEANKNVEMRSIPKLSTLNGHQAKLSIGSKRYYKTTTQNVIPSLQTTTVTTEQFTPVEANMNIDIKPVISGDDQITLKITVDISDFVGTVKDGQPPPTSTSKFESIIRARNEDMIVLGGIERTENSSSGSGVPLLSRIPVLKWLFSSREKTTNKVVSVVFIKPTIIY
ncbi:secretin and TonB N-terminal domain-containing protein [Sphingobacterium spiritivorum]|uniref:secretin and TonB N-terminal domain-containing protein n=1 Tax=Sphingobacterium spiritivorum TaxID=258 RepID=UPI00056A2531|nr:secretin and TonB N-terminal domain-containing protein [Sphingobacterium spiritivorum]QQT34554.1 secretin and TonB N-terminal domain-containing protein [Sphingobacterium spiritivorum]WQD35427.1 secretin and TonB N-terminal domain-containing protein [Sphingobacterium spiritivorum]SUJ00360.1 Pullulanase secretion envelope pulD [Sphingobacterium spiritivorum]